MSIVDIHSHILPAMDDGAKDEETAVQILREMKKQGITQVVASPHFVAQESSLSEFMFKRQQCYENLLKATQGEDLPEVFLGAEVYCFRGMARSKELKRLALGNTRYILIELPHDYISPTLLEEIGQINENLGLVPIFAHIERYIGETGFKDLLRFIERNPCFAQVNAKSLLIPGTKRKVLKLIKKGYISFIATDSHSMNTRAPKMEQALDVLEASKTGRYDEILENMDDIAYELIAGKSING